MTVPHFMAQMCLRKKRFWGVRTRHSTFWKNDNCVGSHKLRSATLSYTSIPPQAQNQRDFSCVMIHWNSNCLYSKEFPSSRNWLFRYKILYPPKFSMFQQGEWDPFKACRGYNSQNILKYGIFNFVMFESLTKVWNIEHINY